MNRTHDERCRCAKCRHARFNPGPPTSARRVNFYGAFQRSRDCRRPLFTALASEQAAKYSSVKDWQLPKVLMRLALRAGWIKG